MFGISKISLQKASLSYSMYVALDDVAGAVIFTNASIGITVYLIGAFGTHLPFLNSNWVNFGSYNPLND